MKVYELIYLLTQLRADRELRVCSGESFDFGSLVEVDSESDGDDGDVMLCGDLEAEGNLEAEGEK